MNGRGAVAWGVSAWLAACSFAPPYSRPKSTEGPDHYRESTDWKEAQPSDAAPKGDWWTMYADPQLNALESKAADANQNLKAAFARLQQARADTRIARADLFPSIDAKAYAEKARISPNSPQYIEGRSLV